MATTPGRNRFGRLWQTVWLLPWLLAFPAAGAVQLSGVFGDHMVIQCDRPIRIWGWANPGESVRVTFGADKVTTTTDAAGAWQVELPARPASAAPNTITVTGPANQIAIRDVLMGEVWLCSGQSNMEWALARSDGGLAAIANATNRLFRMGRVPHNGQATPQKNVAVKWDIFCSSNSLRFASAIPYWFGAGLQTALGVPVGVLNSSYGGTPIQAWMPAETLRSGPWPQDQWTDPAQARAEFDRRVAATKSLRAQYEAACAAAKAKHETNPPSPAGLPGEFKGATVLWNGEVAPLLGLGIRGVAWYQGENNAYPQVAGTYGRLLPALIRDWRQGWGDGSLPFLVFQIARNRKWQTDPNESSGIAELQEAQAKTVAATPGTALIVTTDMGGPDVHYHGKKPVADRAVAAALQLAYQRSSGFDNPVCNRAEFTHGAAVLTFTNTGGGLVAKNGEPAGFVIAGSDHRFVFATARIQDDSVVVSSPQVSAPVAVRYGWADLPKINLFNRAGLPVGTFRTDDWPLAAQSKASHP